LRFLNDTLARFLFFYGTKFAENLRGPSVKFSEITRK